MRSSTIAIAVLALIVIAGFVLSNHLPAQSLSSQFGTGASSTATSAHPAKKTLNPSEAAHVSGVVQLAPTCPVTQKNPSSACAPKPYKTIVTAYEAGTSIGYQAVQTSADGAYAFTLPPGSYDLRAEGGQPMPRCTAVKVTVSAKQTLTQNLTCDTGIR